MQGNICCSTIFDIRKSVVGGEAVRQTRQVFKYTLSR